MSDEKPLLQLAQEAAEKMAESFDTPDEDFLPILFGEKEGMLEPAVVLLPDVFSDDVPKYVRNKVLEEITARLGFTQVAMINAVWITPVTENEEHGERYEAVAIVSMNILEADFATAKLVRHENAPPTIEEWNTKHVQIGDTEEDSFQLDGEIPRSLRAGLMAA